MDDRIHEHAKTLVDWSARIESGDDVVLSVGDGAHDLAVATARVLGERGANLISLYQSDEITRSYLQGHDSKFDRDPKYQLELYENADSVLALGGGRNTAAMADVPANRQNEYSRSRQAIREARMDTDWVSTVHPTRSLAQQAGMSYSAYKEFVYDAVLRDWEKLADEMATLKDVLDDGNEVTIVGEGTDLTMSIEGRTAVNSAASVTYDSHNLPSGEVFTAPASPEGYVTFDVPMTIRGKRVRDVRLEFNDGAVIDYSASMNEDVIGEVLDTDDGAKRLGELGIGMNRGIDRPTDSILFDEKMAETIHLAVGRSYNACLPDGEDGNESAVHVDLITNMDDGSRLLVDGEVIQQDGRFHWEGGFQP